MECKQMNEWKKVRRRFGGTYNNFWVKAKQARSKLLLCLLFDQETGGSMFFQKVGERLTD
jgi:hypothetical protein